MSSKTERELVRTANQISKWFPNQGKRIKEEARQRAKKVAKRGSHPNSK